MDLFKNVLNKNSNIESDDSSTYNSDVELCKSTILLVMKNLGFLSSYEIEKYLDELKVNYDKSVLYRLRISSLDLDIDEVKKHFNKSMFGYGPLKIMEIRDCLQGVIDGNISTKNSIEIIEEMIYEAKIEIGKYEKVLKDFNGVIKRLNDNYQLTEADKVAMIDYWTTYYKEEKLGYQTEALNEISEMVKSLKSLEYGGYGEKEIEKFQRRCQKELEDGKLYNRNINSSLSYIEENLYFPLKNKYDKELKILKNRLALLDDAGELSNFLKLLKREEFIIDFNERNGHKIDLDNQLVELSSRLRNLKYGGYGEKVIDDFIKYSDTMIVEKRKAGLSDREILAYIRMEANSAEDWYNLKLKKLEKEIENVVDLEAKEELIRAFKDEMGQAVNLDEAMDDMIEKLVDSGNCTASEIEAFKKRCEEVESKSIFDLDVVTAVNKIDELYEALINKNKNKKEEILYSKVNFYCERLKNLNGNGYGDSAREDFSKACCDVIESDKTFEEKSLIIDRKAKILEDEYFRNLRLFTVWKQRQLNEGVDSEEVLRDKVQHILSLSPFELQDYYEEDERVKRAEMEVHNNRILVKYLASEEAATTGDMGIVDARLKSLSEGYIPYIADDLDIARKQLESIEDDLDEKLISISQYIDSTLFKQISDIEFAEEQKQKFSEKENIAI